MKRTILVAGISLALTYSASAESPRQRSYRDWVLYYLKLTGLTQVEPVFTSRRHPSFCAWVTNEIQGFDIARNQVVFGISYPDPECLATPARMLALHEVCHVRYAHLDPTLGQQLTTKQKHQEVAQCIKDYKEREKQEGQ